MSFYTRMFILCRMVDPRVDLVTAPWHPLVDTPWKMPLLSNLSDWRSKLDDIENDLYFNNNMTEVVFIADMPGVYLNNNTAEDGTLNFMKTGFQLQKEL